VNTVNSGLYLRRRTLNSHESENVEGILIWLEPVDMARCLLCDSFRTNCHMFWA